MNAIMYLFPGGPPSDDALRQRAKDEGVSWDPQRVITVGEQHKGYTGVSPSDLTQSEKDQIMTALVDMTGQNVSGPLSLQDVLDTTP